MRVRKLKLSVAAAAAVLLAGGIGLYCFEPILPAPIRTAAWRASRAASYGHGWLDASVDAALGRYRYSFEHYLAVGIADYAVAHDGIGRIPHDPRDLAYVAAFNRRIAPAIRKRVGSDFPDGYVRHYVREGWLDLILGQPTRCPVHHIRMSIAVVPVEDAFPGGPRWQSPAVREEYFPFPASARWAPPSFVPRPMRVRTRVCPGCTEAEHQWRLAQRLFTSN